jgi:DNA-binding response OmpR family regulator
VDARILVVEDDASIAELIERNLQTAGFSTRRVAEGDLALGAVREFAPDLVVLDIMLPGLDGVVSENSTERQSTHLRRT